MSQTSWTQENTEGYTDAELAMFEDEFRAKMEEMKIDEYDDWEEWDFQEKSFADEVARR